MNKMNLPVILLKGITLLPNNNIRLEFDNEVSHNIIEMAESFHDNNILVVSQANPFEELAESEDSSRIGIVSKISHHTKLPNGKKSVLITGTARAYIHEYLNLNKDFSVMESIVSLIDEEIEDKNEEEELVKKINIEIDNYIHSIPYSNIDLGSLINDINNLSKLTDVIASHLVISQERLYEYSNEIDPIIRAEMILDDIYKEKEMFAIEKKLNSKVKKDLDNNQKEFMLREKMKAIKQELGEVTQKEDEADSLREKINNLDANQKIKDRLFSELKRYDNLSPMSPEVNVVRNYMEWLISLPWNKYTTDNDSLNDVLEKLDLSHNGLDKVKERIIEYLAVKKMTNNLKSPIICFVGPPGVGKTSLAFSIAAAMNRNFVKMSVGGINDESEIIGHRRTYLGANPGRIIQSLKKAKSSNPVFLIDEIDKMTKDYKGDPASALLEVLDPEQNQYFSDNYIEEEYDLSQVMFIATANYIDDIPEALKDRLEIINLSGYTEYEKLDIAKKHLIPKIVTDHGMEKDKIEFREKAILQIIRSYTKEAGVRELERKISTIVRKIVTEVILQNQPQDKYVINTQMVKKYLGNEKYHFNYNREQVEVGVVNGLAYTYFGGDTLQIEVNYFKGNGNLILTGSLGDVMKESAQIALGYIKASYKELNIDYDMLSNNDIHIHVPEGATPKDGPSAGIAITTAIISALTNKVINKSLAMTGEITLRGNVLPIGGLKEKSIGAHRSGIRTIIVPKKNLNDLEDVPKEIKEDINYIFVNEYKEVIQYINEQESLENGILV